MFTIHVVNSVKGGCGKSTFCLFLENYLLESQKNNLIETDENKEKDLVNRNPIIIDLDLSGSSWYRNNKNFLERRDVKFIDDLIEDFNRNIRREYIFRIKENITNREASDSEREERYLEIVMADPDRAGNIKGEELDLFENSIYRLIKELVAKGKTDIILDMPPGYESYTERIVKHLLFDLSSSLYKEYVIPDNNKTKYKVKLYMLSGIDFAMEGNVKYINDFYIKANYSAVTENLKADNIYFIFNDFQNSYKNFERSDPDYGTLITTAYNNLIHIYIFKKFKKLNLFVIKYLDSGSFDNIIKAIINPSSGENELNIMKPDCEKFYEVFDKIFKKG